MTTIFSRLKTIFVLILFLFSSLFFKTAVSGETTTQIFFETALNPDGYAYEINPTDGGTLWISDNTAGEIRLYQPSLDQMTVYSGLGAVSDARPDSLGNTWFIDQDADLLGKLDPSSGAVQYWPLDTTITPFGTGIDPQNRVWITVLRESFLYRFTPGTGDAGTMCRLELGTSDFNGSYYVIDQDGTVWLGGSGMVHRLIALNDSQYQLTQFLPQDGLSFSVESLHGDGQGGLWVTDSAGKGLILLIEDPQGGAAFHSYAVPGGIPYMLTLQHDLVWYSAQPGVIGALSPAENSGVVHPAVVSESTVSLSCEELSASSASTDMTIETPQWTETSYPIEMLNDWTTFDLGDGSYPWGITQSGSELWIVDQGRQVLMRTAVQATISACKYSDADGDLSSSDDRSAVDAWQMTLIENGVPVSTRETGVDGCASWSSLPLGINYAVEEEGREGWEALHPTDGLCEAGILSRAEPFTCSFVNYRQESKVFIPLVIR